MDKTITFTKEELDLLYESMSNYKDSSYSHVFYNHETDTELTDEDKFFILWNNIMEKL